MTTNAPLPTARPRRRQSSIELLRIISMLMILTVHADGASLGLPAAGTSWSAGQWWQTIIEAIAITGVDIFVLISGYFMIRTTTRRVVNYLIICAFYAIGIYVVHCFITPADFTWERSLGALAVFSGSDLWFIRDYLYLMLLAPLLNGGLKSLSDRNLNLTLLALVVINCYFGWWHGGSVNPTGYNLMQMIFMYVVGYRLSRGLPSAVMAASLYVTSTALIVGMATLMPSARAYAYNSPAVIVATMSIFTLFARMKFSSRAVNAIASSTFAVYLIHKNPYVWVSFMRPEVVKLAARYSGPEFFLWCSLFVVAIFVGCIIIDKVRYYLHIRW